MKIKVMMLALATTLASQAAVYTLSNGASATSNGIGNNAGVAYQNSANASFAGPGVTQFGIFSTDALSSATSSATLISAFTPFSGINTFAAAGPAGARGTFTNAAAPFLITGSQFAGKNMYLFVGNGSTFVGSTEYLVLKTTFVFNASDDSNPNPIVNTLTAGNSTVLFGKTSADLRTTTADASATPGFGTVVPIPEPSAALLGAIGALGLLRRRRN